MDGAMNKNYTNAKKLLPKSLYNELSEQIPQGGLVYVPPQSARSQEIRSQVALFVKDGLSTAEMAKRLKRTVRRVNQLKREMGL